ncbi:type III-B CRISPR module-associated protein Cmr3 [Suttonella indologenes]|uniref:Uncharacterized protein n=1 Tax=Suttonella indologenes TaxID=13276 RepID=A0A380MIV2_9GAMM|nr:type III-B CRISPR module-associated protein Cmr3 [Suttonella indologenes]SUO91269.1 Uncharacterised protein [Suttonella indologenes]
MKTELENRLNALQDLNALATELIIARWLAAKTQRDLGENIMNYYIIDALSPLVFRSGKPFGAQSDTDDIMFPLPSAAAV